jgi:hypothetical protein
VLPAAIARPPLRHFLQFAEVLGAILAFATAVQAETTPEIEANVLKSLLDHLFKKSEVSRP